MSTVRDRRIAEEAEEDRALLCSAAHCPCKWTVDRGAGRLCSSHAWADWNSWPSITQELLDAEAERAIGHAVPMQTTLPLTRDEKVAKLRELQLLFRDKRDTARNAPGKGWAHALMERESRGESLTPAQRAMWREALGPSRATAHHDEPEVPA